MTSSPRRFGGFLRGTCEVVVIPMHPKTHRFPTQGRCHIARTQGACPRAARLRAYVSFVKPCASGSSVLVRGEAVFSIHFMNIYDKIIRFLQKGIWPLIMVVVSPVPRYADTTGDVDRSRAGEMLLKHEVWMMEEFVYPYATVDVRWLPVVNISAIGRAFQVRPAGVPSCSRLSWSSRHCGFRNGCGGIRSGDGDFRSPEWSWPSSAPT